MRKPRLFFAALAVLIAVSGARAAVTWEGTFIPATTANTTSGTTPWYDAVDAWDNLWYVGGQYAGLDGIRSNGSWKENTPRLTTTIPDLISTQTYTVYAIFYGAYPGSNCAIAAGLHGSAVNNYHTTTAGVLDAGDQVYKAPLGTLSGISQLQVDIDDGDYNFGEGAVYLGVELVPQITSTTFIPASASNTTSAAAPWSAAENADDNLWYVGGQYAGLNGMRSVGSWHENCPTLTTAVSGLKAALNYEVYVVFYGIYSGSNCAVTAGLHGTAMNNYYTATPGVIHTGNQVYKAPLGTVSGVTQALVDIDDGDYSFGEGTTYLGIEIAPRLQNPAFNVPQISRIKIDGNISNWPASTEWSDPFVTWNVPAGQTPLTSSTRAKFAWNKSSNMLYVAIRTDETSSLPGGHAVVGVSTDINNAAYTGNGATQLAFETTTGNAVNIMNEIDYYADKYAHGWLGWHSGIQDVQAAWSFSGGVYTYELAIPLWTNWVTMTEKKTLNPGDIVYLYSIMESYLESTNGTNMTWFGNPNFAYETGFQKAAALTLVAGPALIPGDANNDGKVDVSDLGILAANYGLTAGAAWELGDFNDDGKVDVSDLGILAANYGTGAGATLDFNADAQALGLTLDENAKTDTTTVGLCGTAGLPLIAGVLLAALLLLNGQSLKFKP